jgi:hypothetical protein
MFELFCMTLALGLGIVIPSLVFLWGMKKLGENNE